MVFIAVLSIFVGLSRSAGGGTGLSLEAIHQIGTIQAGIAQSLVGRRLLEETREIPWQQVEKLENGAFVKYRRSQPSFLVFDLNRMKTWHPWDLELALVREMARASLALPIDVPEEDMAAYQLELQYAVERAQSDSGFSRRLRQSFGNFGRLAEVGAAGELLEAPRAEMERIAYFLQLFMNGSDEFYWAVEKARSFAPDSLRLIEIENFILLHGPDFSSVEVAPKSRYVRIGGRRYPAALVRAAKKLAQAGGLEQIQEALASVETAPAPLLRLQITRWLKKSDES